MTSGSEEFEQKKQDAARRLRQTAAKGQSAALRSVPAGYDGNAVAREESQEETEPTVGSAEEMPVPVSVPAESGGLFGSLTLDDALLLGLFVLLYHENKREDSLILLVLAVLFFS